ncbi:MAG: hypothetical protein RL398_3339 [Planctomycetota bacterium]|jgi:hypothetical protein
MRPYAALLSLVALAACGHRHDHAHVVPAPPPPRPVSILVEVYDPITNFVWENVSVRIVESEQEWSQCTCVSPYLDWRLTDSSGRVYFDEYDLALADVGFVEDVGGRALLHADEWQDEATVWLEIDAVGFTPILVPVHLRWSSPDVYVEVPF